MLIWGWLFHLFLWIEELKRKGPPKMPAIKDLYAEAIAADQTVSADKAKLDADTTTAANDHQGLVAAVVANGPTAFVQADGSIVGLIPQEDGTLQTINFKDGSTAAPSA